MRTTLDIDDDLLAAAKELARRQGSSTGQVVSRLMRRSYLREAQTDAHNRAEAKKRVDELENSGH